MIIFVNNKNEIKDVDFTEDQTLRAFEIIDGDLNPFTNWPVAKICCYRVGLIPETVTEITGFEEVKYIDEEGNEVTETVDVTETRETGKYIISMMTPYVDSRIIEHIEQLGRQVETNTAGIMETQDAVCESSMINEEHFLEIETALCESSMSAEDKFLEIETALCESSMDTEERFALSDDRILEIETALCDLSMLIM